MAPKQGLNRTGIPFLIPAGVASSPDSTALYPLTRELPTPRKVAVMLAGFRHMASEIRSCLGLRGERGGTGTGDSFLRLTGGLEYLGSLIYKRNADNELTLESTSFGGGRIEVAETSDGLSYTPNYFIADHLGSTRAVVKLTPGGLEVLERNDYLPYGGRWEVPGAAISDNRFRFSGKEDQTIGNLPYQDFGARFLISKKLPIFTQPDPLAELRPWESPFLYTGSNPISRVDPTGLFYFDTAFGNSVMSGLGQAPGYVPYSSPQPTEEEPVHEIETVTVTAKKPKEQKKPDFVSLAVGVAHTDASTIAKSGKFRGYYKGPKVYSTRFNGNQSVSAAKMAAQKARFAKTLKVLKNLKRAFTFVGAVDAVAKADALLNKIQSGQDIDVAEIYEMTSATISMGGVAGAYVSFVLDLNKANLDNAERMYEKTGNEDLYYRMLQTPSYNPL